MPFVTSLVSLIDQLAAIHAAVLDTSAPAHTVCHLAKGTFAPTPSSDPTTFTEADFTGYADKTITAWTTEALRLNQVSEVIPTTVLFWQPTGTTVTNLITGYWLVGGNGHYLGGEAFSTPISMASPTDALYLLPKWQVALGNWSGEIVP